MSQRYDLRPSRHADDESYTVNVFNSSVTWNQDNPYVIQLQVLYEPNNTCQGFFERHTCNLQAAKMSVPVQVSSDRAYLQAVGTSEYSDLFDILSPVITTATSTTIANFTAIKELPISATEGQNSSTFGGVAQWLGSKFNGSIDWTLRNGTWTAQKTGPVARAYQLNTFIIPQGPYGSLNYTASYNFNPKPNNISWCQNVYTGPDWTADIGLSYSRADPVTEIYKTLTQLMLGVSALETGNAFADPQNKETVAALAADGSDKQWDEFWTDQLRQMSQHVSKAEQMQGYLFYKIRYRY